MTDILIEISPHVRPDGSAHPNTFDVFFGGALVCTSETPFFSAARWLLARGMACRDDTLVMQHRGSDTVSLRAKVWAAAGATIEETGHGPKQRKYRPRPVTEAPRIEQNEEAATYDPARPSLMAAGAAP